MAEQPPWKFFVRARVVGVCEYLQTADEHLKRVEANFLAPVEPVAGMPWPASWVAAVRAKHLGAMQSLRAASDDLDWAAVNAGVAEALAVHGGNANDPSVPLPFLAPLAQTEPKVHDALLSLRTCSQRAGDAFKFAQWCRGYLSTAIALLDSPGVPDNLITANREFDDSARVALTTAMLATETALGQANLARQIITS